MGHVPFPYSLHFVQSRSRASSLVLFLFSSLFKQAFHQFVPNNSIRFSLFSSLSRLLFLNLSLVSVVSWSYLAASAASSPRAMFRYNVAVVRAMSSNFLSSLKMDDPKEPIDLSLAKAQHQAYNNVIKSLLPRVIELEGSDEHPDCNFIEDTSVVIGRIALINVLGAPSRRGEARAVKETLQREGLNVIEMVLPATLDGGDVLVTSRHILVGRSNRTNDAGIEQLRSAFASLLPVVVLPVTDGLHFKSFLSLLDVDTIVVAECSAAQACTLQLEQFSYKCIFVPDIAASNVLRIRDTVLVQEGFPKSHHILAQVCEEQKLAMMSLSLSELIKADGALTCGSLLF